MHRSLLTMAAIFLAAASSFGQARTGFDLSNYGVRIEPDKRLIVVLGALNMAGTKDASGQITPALQTPLTPAGSAFREQLLRDNAEMPDDLRNRLATFVAQYKKAHPGVSDAELVNPFISMAYALSAAPDLSDPVVTSDLPGSLLDVLDFAPLVREFWRRSTIAAKIDDYIKTYRTTSDTTLRISTREMVGELLDYLHTRPQLIFTENVRVETQKSGSKTTKIYTNEKHEHDRHFYLVPEALAPKGTVNFLNVRDDYYVVIPPDTDLAGSEGRRAFLRFVIDPLVLANAKEMQPIRDWAKPVLADLNAKDRNISTDAFLAMERSIVAAADVRQTEYLRIRAATEQARRKIDTLTNDADKRAVSADLEKQKQAFSDEAALQLYEDYQKGAVLAFYFADQFRGIEDSGFDIASSLKDMVQAFDGTKESGRLAATADARARALAAREARKNTPRTVVTPTENPVTARLLEIQKTIAARDLTKAQADLKQLLSQYPGEPRIYYNLGRVAGLSATGLQDPDAQAAKLLDAKAAYTNVISSANSNTDPILLSLTYVALGRVYEFFNDEAYALKLYDKAIQLGDVRGGAFSEALAAKQRLVKTQP